MKLINHGISMKTEFSADWKIWIKTNVDNGQDKNGLFKVLLDEGYNVDAISKQMDYYPDIPLDQLVNPFSNQSNPPKEPTPSVHGAAIDKALFIPNATSLNSDRLQLIVLENFLNAEECDHIVEAIKTQLRPSELSSFEADAGFRTSKTCDLGNLSDPLIKHVDERICRLIGVDESYSETIQGQYYEIGQEFKPHTDYFEANELASNTTNYGQRTYTVMVYLNTVEEGGVTRFPKIDSDVHPQQGMAVIWSSLNPDGSPNDNSLHQAQPVLKGYKAVITKWFRTRSRLAEQPPMFCRQANDFIPNYTKIGFAKTQLAASLLKKIQAFYGDNLSDQQHETVPGDFIFNSAGGDKKSSTLVNLNDDLRQEIHDALKIMMEDWCGHSLMPTFVYGIRVYHRGAVLRCHQDRLETHIISAIINVDQHVDSDWPLVIDDNYYRSHEVTLKPGEIILYEGGRLSHGRPHPLDGEFFANIFCHFKPTDYVPRTVTQDN